MLDDGFRKNPRGGQSSHNDPDVGLRQRIQIQHADMRTLAKNPGFGGPCGCNQHRVLPRQLGHEFSQQLLGARIGPVQIFHHHQRTLTQQAVQPAQQRGLHATAYDIGADPLHVRRAQSPQAKQFCKREKIVIATQSVVHGQRLQLAILLGSAVVVAKKGRSLQTLNARVQRCLAVVG